MLTPRQKRFVDEYIVDANATQSAIRAGYSEKTAKSIGQRLLTFVNVRSAIDKRLTEISNRKIAKAQEIQEYLTSVMRGESRSSVVVTESYKDGSSRAKIIEKPPDEKERLRAAELLGKRYGLYTHKVEVESKTPIVIKEDLDD